MSRLERIAIIAVVVIGILCGTSFSNMLMSAYGQHPTFEEDTEAELRRLRGYCDQNEAKIIKLELILAQRDFRDTELRLRYLEAEAQKAETGLAIMKWAVGLVVILVPVLGIKLFYRRHKEDK